MIIAIDFDHTIHNLDDREPGYRMGKPFPGAKETINRWADQGHGILIHSVRAATPSGERSIAEWLDYFGIVYDNILPKPYADRYIDDRALQFTGSWAELEEKLG